MELYIELIGASAGAIVLSAVFYLFEKKTSFGRWNGWGRQIVIGFVFGLLSIAGTEFGIDVGGAVLNTRDAAPLCAGLIFGAPAGILAGVMGGAERYLAVAWGAGTFTREACSIATISAGILAGMFRKYMFDDKKPSWFYGPLLASITEVFHMLLVFAIHINIAREAFVVVKACTVPMVILNSVSVGGALAVVSLLSGKRVKATGDHAKISQVFQKWLLIFVTGTFLITSGFTYLFESRVSEMETVRLLELGINDVKNSISQASDENLLKVSRKLKNVLDTSDTWKIPGLTRLSQEFVVSEINMIGPDGVIYLSTAPAFIGYDMSQGEQSAEFLVLNEGNVKEYVQKYGPVSFDSSISRKYAGIANEDGGFVQIGYDFSRFQRDLSDIVKAAADHRHVGEQGFMIICDEKMKVVSGNEQTNVEESWSMNPEELRHIEKMSLFEKEINGEPYYGMYDITEGYSVFAVRPVSEATFFRDMTVYLSIFMEVLVFAILFVVVYILVKLMVVNNIIRINESLSEITHGNLDITVDVKDNEEFASLSSDINATVATLKQYIADAAARIDQELEYARNIQYSSLPHVFPPYPERNEFEIWAGMMTAKEVGGDFYDFYFVAQNKLAFLVADVSGKGIPASLFMMRSKTMIKNLASTGMDADEVFIRSNNNLCENNEAEMFVTAWFGILDLETGIVRYANAGHNPPLVLHQGDPEGFRYVHSKRSLVLAGMEGISYRINEMELSKGDIIFLYTDGVSEATNSSNELYGDDRLRLALNSISDIDSCSMEDICKKVKTDVDAFVGEAPQFDDITMLCLKYEGFGK